MKTLKDNPTECMLAFFRQEVVDAISENAICYDLIDKAAILVGANMDAFKRTKFYLHNKGIVPRSLFYLDGVFILAFYRDPSKKLLLGEAAKMRELVFKQIQHKHYYSDILENLALLAKLTKFEFNTIYKYRERYYIDAPNEFISELKIMANEFLIEGCSVDKSVLDEHGEIFIAKNASQILREFY